MDAEQTYRAMQWFAAGYLAADPNPPHYGSNAEGARIAAARYVERHRRGDCLGCGRSGVVLLDLFCERCHYPISPIAENELDGGLEGPGADDGEDDDG